MIAISPYQLFSLMVLFQFGTTVIFGFASGAGRDAWISASVSSLLGALLIAGYATITKLNGYISLVGCFRKQLGRWVGTPLAWLYPLLFIYELARGISDLKFLVPLTLLPKTPTWLLTAVFMMLVIYTVHAGLEVLCRVAGVLLPLLIAFILLETLLLIASGSLRVEYLMPVFGEGFRRVAENIWPIGIMQSYGESIEMAVFWCLVTKQGHLGRISVGATLFAGLFIVLFDVLSITALGEHLFHEMMLPAFTTLKLTSVGGFLENLDALGSLYFVCTAFIKISVHVLAAALCIRELTFAGKNNAAIWITASSAYVVGMTMASNFSEHLHVGIKIIPNILLVPMFVVLPGLVFLLSLFGKTKKTGAE